ncbi:MAG: nicotinate-nucleotide adenylyltransferase [Nitrosomonas sp.]|nr:nicotinate-nucleotide adenylyltransferase [Nitrosomonas sp.]
MAHFALVGIYGGTFDPVHFGHLRVAEELVSNIAFSRFFFVPSGQPRLRDMPVASKTQRARMVELAIQDNSGFLLDTREIKREGISMTVETLREYQAEYGGGDTALCLIIGADAFLKIHQWWNWHEMFGLCHLIIVNRPGSMLMKNRNDLPEQIQQACAERWTAYPTSLASQPYGLIYVASTTLLDISATYIRAMVAAGKSIRYLLPDAVSDYIKTHQLYMGEYEFKKAGRYRG